MGYRRPKSETRRHTLGWPDWIGRNRAELVAIGVPAEVYLDESRWNDFLENGHLHWHASSGFEFGHLSAGQLAAMRRLLEREHGQADECPPLLRWVRVRCGSDN